MATIESKDIVIKLMENNGYYDNDDPQVTSVYAYRRKGPDEKELYAIFYRREDETGICDLAASRIDMLWHVGGGATIEGVEWLLQNKRCEDCGTVSVGINNVHRYIGGPFTEATPWETRFPSSPLLCTMCGEKWKARRFME